MIESFDELWKTLNINEQSRLLRLLIESAPQAALEHRDSDPFLCLYLAAATRVRWALPIRWGHSPFRIRRVQQSGACRRKVADRTH